MKKNLRVYFPDLKHRINRCKKHLDKWWYHIILTLCQSANTLFIICHMLGRETAATNCLVFFYDSPWVTQDHHGSPNIVGKSYISTYIIIFNVYLSIFSYVQEVVLVLCQMMAMGFPTWFQVTEKSFSMSLLRNLPRELTPACLWTSYFKLSRKWNNCLSHKSKEHL